ncbi:hypothetical protein XA68_18362 [Ophiocordyceps unilateralis]|uniref:Profilin n=1 Tax=Ophiocordyceps unilateralis TaxID=268505 RepID=A0A2A9PHR6_OPHUN|nr:hypothetical protein XA68_18362 [Ophiocordyceps unilateralis]
MHETDETGSIEYPELPYRRRLKAAARDLVFRLQDPLSAGNPLAPDQSPFASSKQLPAPPAPKKSLLCSAIADFCHRHLLAPLPHTPLTAGLRPFAVAGRRRILIASSSPVPLPTSHLLSVLAIRGTQPCPGNVAYVDSSLVGSGHVDKAAIISAAGDSTWAASPGFELKPNEMKIIASIAAGDEEAKTKAYSDGLYLAGNRYVMARADDGKIYARSGKIGVAIAKTTQAIVIGHHGENQVAGNTTSTVESLAQYLIGLKY